MKKRNHWEIKYHETIIKKQSIREILKHPGNQTSKNNYQETKYNGYLEVQLIYKKCKYQENAGIEKEYPIIRSQLSPEVKVGYEKKYSENFELCKNYQQDRYRGNPKIHYEYQKARHRENSKIDIECQRRRYQENL